MAGKYILIDELEKIVDILDASGHCPKNCRLWDGYDCVDECPGKEDCTDTAECWWKYLEGLADTRL